MIRRRTIQLVAVATMLTVAIVVPPSAVAAPACGQRTGAWRTIPVPPASKSTTPGFNDWSGSASLVAADGSISRLFMTDGRRLLRSTDGGCVWASVFSIGNVTYPATDPTSSTGGAGQLPDDDPYYVIAALGMGPSRSDSPHANYRYAVVADKVSQLDGLPVYVAVSSDAGEHWQLTMPSTTTNGLSSPMLFSGTFTGNRETFVAPEIEVSPRDGCTAYLKLASYLSGPLASPTYPLYVTHDCGVTWSLRGEAFYGRIVIDPIDDRTLWSTNAWDSSDVSARSVHLSVDDGATWTALVPRPQSTAVVTDLDVRHRPGRAAQITAWGVIPVGGGATQVSVDESLDGGVTWRALPSPLMGQLETSLAGLGLDPRNQDIVALANGYTGGSGTGLPNEMIVSRWSRRKTRWLFTSVSMPFPQTFRPVGLDQRFYLAAPLWIYDSKAR